MVKNTNKLNVIYGDTALGVKGNNFNYIFSYQENGPVSFFANNKEWLYRSPRPTFWRATTDNDRGNGFSKDSSQWYAADQFIDCVKINVVVDGKNQKLPIAPINNKFSNEEFVDEVKITYVYQTTIIPKTTVKVVYCVDNVGDILTSVKYKGQGNLPSLPVFGLKFVMPTPSSHYEYKGLSGETYPDRKKGGIKGVYDIKGMPVTPYLVPQDCGMHMDTNWVKIYRNSVLNNKKESISESYLQILAVDKEFAFTCLPYSAQELEQATHQEELPTVNKTVLCILGAVRGVGGIDSWGSDVLEKYHINATTDINYKFKINFGN